MLALPVNPCPPAPVTRLRLVAFAVTLACSAGAQTQAVAAVGTLREVVVSGARSEHDADEQAARVDVVNREKLEARQIRDIHDFAPDLPNVTVHRAPPRFTQFTRRTLAGQPAFGRCRNAEAQGRKEKFWPHPELALTPAYRRRALIRLDALLLIGFGPRLPQAVGDVHPRLLAL